MGSVRECTNMELAKNRVEWGAQKRRKNTDTQLVADRRIHTEDKGAETKNGPFGRGLWRNHRKKVHIIYMVAFEIDEQGESSISEWIHSLHLDR